MPSTIELIDIIGHIKLLDAEFRAKLLLKASLQAAYDATSIE